MPLAIVVLILAANRPPTGAIPSLSARASADHRSALSRDQPRQQPKSAPAAESRRIRPSACRPGAATWRKMALPRPLRTGADVVVDDDDAIIEAVVAPKRLVAGPEGTADRTIVAARGAGRRTSRPVRQAPGGQRRGGPARSGRRAPELQRVGSRPAGVAPSPSRFRCTMPARAERAANHGGPGNHRADLACGPARRETRETARSGRSRLGASPPWRPGCRFR